MSKLVLYVYYYYPYRIDLSYEMTDCVCSNSETINLFDLKIIDGDELDELLLDDATVINSYGEIINYNLEKVLQMLWRTCGYDDYDYDYDYKILSRTVIKYMKIEELKDIRNVIDAHIANKKFATRQPSAAVRAHSSVVSGHEVELTEPLQPLVSMEN